MSEHRKRKVILSVLLIVSIFIVILYQFFQFSVFSEFYNYTYGVQQVDIRDFNEPQCRILTVLPGGRLGNIIWDYMALLAFQKIYFINGTIFLFPAMKKTLQNVFDGIDNSTINDDTPTRCIHTAYNKTIDVMEEPKSFNFSRNNLLVILHAWSSRYPNVLNYGLENIKKKLRFRKKLINTGTTMLKTIKASFGFNRTENVTFIGVHYRGGDYVPALRNNYKKKFLHPPSYLYYKNAMTYFQSTAENPIFVFVSIDKGWTAENLVHLQDFKVFKYTPRKPEEDLVVLSLCNHSIINYGTYGATAAMFTNGGTTFVYDLKLPNDGKGYTVANGMAKLVPNWFLCDDSTPCGTNFTRVQFLNKE